MKTSLFFCCFLLIYVTFTTDAWAQQQARSETPTPPDGTQQCVALSRVNFEKTTGAATRITSTRVMEIADGDFDNARRSMMSAPAKSSAIKRYCQVLGYVAPQNKFELRLPMPREWNEKFYFSACAGFCGAANGAACNAGLARGYATVTGNGGHDSGFPGFDGLWAAGDPVLQEDFAWRSNHLITLAAKAITTRYYGRPIQRSYMAGCSKGGQAVLMEGERFPQDYDALMPMAPVYDLVGRGVIAAAWYTQAISDGNGGSVLNAEVADIVHRSILAACGAQVGVDIGFVTEPSACNWKAEMITCPAAGSGTNCLTPAQAAAIKRIMTPITNSKGEVLYAYPYIPGTETEWVGWNFVPQTGALSGHPANYDVVDQFLKYLADPKPRREADSLKFNFDRDPATLSRARKIYDATSYDLSAFRARGGKILMWHGLADGGISATSSIGYYEGVMKAMGGRQKTEEFFRLFLIPGVHHCAGGPGFTDFDALTALENWVDKGQAPSVLIAQHLANGTPERALPIYPYPVVPRYSGKGDPKQASSFIPFDPTSK